jgi:hypothetical protein
MQEKLTRGMAALFKALADGGGIVRAQSDAFRLVGALWLGITLLSIIGIFKPVLMTPVFLLQLWYKGTWLIAALIQASVDKNLGSVPPQMAVFFAVWIVVLPFAIPWRHFFAAGDAAFRA